MGGAYKEDHGGGWESFGPRLGSGAVSTDCLSLLPCPGFVLTSQAPSLMPGKASRASFCLH